MDLQVCSVLFGLWYSPCLMYASSAILSEQPGKHSAFSRLWNNVYNSGTLFSLAYWRADKSSWESPASPGLHAESCARERGSPSGLGMAWLVPIQGLRFSVCLMQVCPASLSSADHPPRGTAVMPCSWPAWWVPSLPPDFSLGFEIAGQGPGELAMPRLAWVSHEISLGFNFSR